MGGWAAAPTLTENRGWHTPRMLLMFSFVEFYAMEIICYTHCYSTRTVMVTIYVTGDMIELLYLITANEISLTGNCISIVISY